MADCPRDIWMMEEPTTVHRVCTHWLLSQAKQYRVEDVAELAWDQQWPLKESQGDAFGSRHLQTKQAYDQLVKSVRNHRTSSLKTPLDHLRPGQRCDFEIQVPVSRLESYLWPNKETKSSDYDDVCLRTTVTAWAMDDAETVVAHRARMWHATQYPRPVFVAYASWVLANGIRILFTQRVSDESSKALFPHLESRLLQVTRPANYEMWFSPTTLLHPTVQHTSTLPLLYMSAEGGLLVESPTLSSGFALEAGSNSTISPWDSKLLSKSEIWDLLLKQDVLFVQVPSAFNKFQ